MLISPPCAYSTLLSHAVVIITHAQGKSAGIIRIADVIPAVSLEKGIGDRNGFD